MTGTKDAEIKRLKKEVASLGKAYERAVLANVELVERVAVLEKRLAAVSGLSDLAD